MTTEPRASLGFACAALLAAACAPLDDTVFRTVALEAPEPVSVMEGSLTVEIPVTLGEEPAAPLSLDYELVPLEAQNHCHEPDFEAAAGQVHFEAGEATAMVRVFIGDDALAETDERFELRVGDAVRLTIRILDDDRSALLDSAAFGVAAGTGADQAPALQAALDEALAIGRGVVLVPAGDYELSGVTLPQGVTLSARGASFHRPPGSGDVVGLRIEHTGESDALPVLVEGASFDGRREEQGPYRDNERENAHLIALRGDGMAGGRVNASFEGVALSSGTASGVMVGPDVNVSACSVRASELWRDAVTVIGGATRVRLRDLDATASEGTGLWVGPRNWGYAEDLSVDAELEDVRIAAGDVELEATTGSTLVVRRLTMTEPPFRLDAPGGSVRIADSVLMLGLPSDVHDFIGAPHDVEIGGTTLIVSERAAPGEGALEEASRTFSAVNVRTTTLAGGEGPSSTGALSFVGCHFELAADVEGDDSVTAIDNANPDVGVTVSATELGPGFAGFFGEGCVGCTLAP